MLSKLERLEPAIKAYTLALRLQPRWSSTSIAKAQTLHKLQRDEEALAVYDKALQLEQEDYFLRFFRAHALQEMKRYEEATAAYKQAQQVAPGPIFEAHCILARGSVRRAAQGETSGEQLEHSPILLVEEEGQKAVKPYSLRRHRFLA